MFLFWASELTSARVLGRFSYCPITFTMRSGIKFANLPIWQFANWPICKFANCANLPICKFANLPICQFANLPICQLCQLANFPKCKFANLPICHFANCVNLTICQMWSCEGKSLYCQFYLLPRFAKCGHVKANLFTASSTYCQVVANLLGHTLLAACFTTSPIHCRSTYLSMDINRCTLVVIYF